jgi:hypothetical protein
MGAQFNYVVVPKKIQKQEQLEAFYEECSKKLIEKHGGEDFEGYSGDLASDNGELKITDLELELPKYTKALTQKSLEDDWEFIDKILELVTGHVEKWGPSIAIKVNAQWIICGSYSD